MKKYLDHSYKILFFLLFSCSLLFVQSCKKKCGIPVSLDQEEFISTSSGSINTDIYIDVTLSMQGFTKTDGFLSFYQETIPILDRVAPGNKSYWKFGNNPVAINREQYRQLDKFGFYPDPKKFPEFAETRIQNVIQQANENNLTIIVTDLNQEFSDRDGLINLIESKYIKNNKAIGVLAIRSQFDGIIYDVGTNDHDFKYSSGTDPGKFHPFYVLVFGRHEDINQYFDQFDDATKSFESLNNDETGFSIKKRIIFSRYLVDKPINLLEAKITPNNTLATSAPGILIDTNTGKNPFKEFLIKENADGEIFKAELPFNRLNSIISYDEDLQAEIQASVCGGETQNQITEPPIKVVANIEENKKIHLSVSANGKKMIPNVVNEFRIILRPVNFKFPEWVDEWNLTGNEVEQLAKNGPEFKGSKTHDLSPFLWALWKSTESQFKPKVADFYCYFKRG